MSKQVKERRAAQRQEITLNKVANGINKLNHAAIKKDPMEKYRQSFQTRQLNVDYSKLYS